MIDAIFNIPKEQLLVNENKIFTNEKSKIIIVFLGKNYNIIDADKKTYAEWLEDERISQEASKLLDCEKLIGSGDIKPARKGFGGQFGMSTCSPIHFKLTDTYLKTIRTYLDDKKIGGNTKEKTIDKKIGAFLKNGKSGLMDLNYFKDIQEKLSQVIEMIFLERIMENEGKLIFEQNNETIHIDKRDYLLIKIPEEDISYYIKEHKKFFQDLRKERMRRIKTNTKCFICNKRINEGVILLNGNFETEQKKHKQIFHKFYKKINDEPNILICNECNNRIVSFFAKVRETNKMYIPIPLNIRDKENFDYSIIFNKKSLLEKLKGIYEENKNNPFDYVLLTYFDNDNYIFEYIPNFNYILTTNNEILDTKFNEVLNKKEGKVKIIWKREFTKGDFINHLDQIYLNKKLIVYKLFSKGNNLKDTDSFIKLIFSKYKEGIKNSLFKEKYWFQIEGLKRLVHTILRNTCKVKTFKEHFSKNKLEGKKLLLYYFLYSQSGGIQMDIENIKQIENVKLEELKINNDFKAAYFMGQIASYLIGKSGSQKNSLELLGTYLISVNNMDSLKKKLCNLSLRYKHKIMLTKKWKKVNEEVLKFAFNKEKLEDNLIPFFAGFYSDNIFYKKTSGDDSNE